MSPISGIVENIGTAMVFDDPEKMVVGVITDENGMIAAQILNPEKRPPTDTDKFASKHRVIAVRGKEYVAIDLDPLLATERFVETADNQLCSSELLNYLSEEWRKQIVLRKLYRTSNEPNLN